MWIFMTDARLVEDFFTEKVVITAIGNEPVILRGLKAQPETLSNMFGSKSNVTEA